MNRIQKVLGSAAVASLFIIVPLAASADTVNATGSTGVVISPNGIVRVIGAEVTSISNGVFNAVTTIGNVVTNWIVNVSAATKVSGNGSAAGTTTGITVGDKVGFTGTLSSSTTTLLTVAATKVRDFTTFPPRHADVEATSTVGATTTDNDNGKGDDKSVNVNANANAQVHAHREHGGANVLGGLGLHLGEDN